MKGEEARVAFWRVALLVGGLLAWEVLTWAHWPRRIIPFLDPFFISSPSRIAHRFVYHMSGAATGARRTTSAATCPRRRLPGT